MNTFTVVFSELDALDIEADDVISAIGYADIMRPYSAIVSVMADGRVIDDTRIDPIVNSDMVVTDADN